MTKQAHRITGKIKVNAMLKNYGANEFLFEEEKENVRRLVREILSSIQIAWFEYHGIEDLVSMRYLLRKEYMTPFCSLIRSTPEGNKRCNASDQRLIEMIKMSRETGRAYWHYCHAGLVDFVFAVRGRAGNFPIIGGQVLFEPLSDAKTEEIIENIKDIPLNRTKIKKAMAEIPVMPLQIIKSVIALVTSIIEESPQTKLIREIPDTRTEARHKKIKSVLEFMAEHYKENYSIEKIAKHLYISSSHLAHIFKKALGISLMDYKNHLRVSAAKEMLKNTNLSITEIAFSLGYDTSNYFCLVFKKKTGYSPSEFRKQSMPFGCNKRPPDRTAVRF